MAKYTMTEVTEAEFIMGWDLSGHQRRLLLALLNTPEKLEVRAASYDRLPKGDDLLRGSLPEGA
jgi:hypothetical protein